MTAISDATIDSTEFNLLIEPWIKVLREDGSTDELSLLEVFREADKLISLAGEMKAQDMAVLRLLLAILHAVFGKQEDGMYVSLTSGAEVRLRIKTVADMLNRWEELWRMKKFPFEIISDYLGKYRDRFWLFHPTHPFYQVPDGKRGTSYPAAKLNGELAESNNKLRLFANRSKEYKHQLEYSEAARWLLYINAYDDTSGKPTAEFRQMIPDATERSKRSPGAGWLGQLGLLSAKGNNLFETLMLNFVLVTDFGDRLWGVEKPVWARENPKTEERTPINVPDNASELLTIQSRRLFLIRDQEASVVNEYLLVGGDFFYKDQECFAEQMTMWQATGAKSLNERSYRPKRHDPSRQMWRDLSSLLPIVKDYASEKTDGRPNRNPGIVNWLATIQNRGILGERQIGYEIAGVSYADKDFYAENNFSDEITMSVLLLGDEYEEYRERILAVLPWTEKIVECLSSLAWNLAIAGGSIGENGKKRRIDAAEIARQEGYFQLDIPFRNWLESLNPKSELSVEASIASWAKQARSIIRSIGRDLVRIEGMNAFTGREYEEQKKKKLMTSPKAYNIFISSIRKQSNP
ncbi:MAG: type I-E CRISPR-associated protein Cse1/CasA [Clostridiaceae bacterium]|nr:type I-E CRISPR-associated protein Cse1/CasA [Clostridiaceae bacterium]